MNAHPFRRVVYGVTVTTTARAFLVGQLRHLADRSWDVHLVVGDSGAEEFAKNERIGGLHIVPTTRDPSIRDPLTLLLLVRLLRRLKPDVTVMGTPKVGVLGTIAAKLAAVPRRVYVVHGYRAEGLTGYLRRAMILLERLGCAAATDVVAVSPSLRALTIAEGVVAPSKVQVLGAGSANGVDLARFRPAGETERAILRRAYGVPDGTRVVCFVGRLTHDKGLRDIPEVWLRLRQTHATSRLLIAGDPEPANSEDRKAIAALRDDPTVVVLGHQTDVQEVFRASDVNLMLSRREGLGMVALEAAACGIPTVGLDVTGLVDAVEDGRTGFLISDGRDPLARVAKTLADVLQDDALRTGMAEDCVVHAQKFSQPEVWETLDCFLHHRDPRDIGAPE